MGSHEGDESHESGKSHEGNESHEGKEGLCAPGQAPRVCRQDCNDSEWAQEVRLGEEQVRQDRQQEEECPFQSQPMDCCLQGCAGSFKDQGLLRRQKGFPVVHQGEGALQEEVIHCGCTTRLRHCGQGTVLLSSECGCDHMYLSLPGITPLK